jgi:hypothetical protein
MQNPRWNESITPFTSAAKERGASKERYYIANKINEIINNSKDDRQAINLILNYINGIHRI